MALPFFDLSARTKLRVSGADRVRFLNGQTTNDIRKATAAATQESCVLNAKGHLDAHIFLLAAPSDIWIDADRELRQQLQTRLNRYVIADDVTIEDVGDAYALFHVLTESKPEGIDTKFCLRSRRLGNDAWDLWVESATARQTKSKLGTIYELKNENEWETLRVESGIPRWGRELTPEIIPPEANLADRAVDYEKGCYIGQEVISRMKMSGQMRQHLCVLLSEKPLFTGMELRAGEKLVGGVTTAAFSQRIGSHLGLALIKRGYTNVGTSLLASKDETQANVRIVSLPGLLIDRI
jgi:tRNA-modifying protein YgfZ